MEVASHRTARVDGLADTQPVSAVPSNAQLSAGPSATDADNLSEGPAEVVDLAHAPIGAPFRAASFRPFAPSLEHLRLQAYALMLISDLAIIMIAFMLGGGLRSGNLFLATAMHQALLLAPLYGALALYNGTYSAKSLTSLGHAVFRMLSAMMLATALLLFVTFYAKISGQFSRIAFTIGTAFALGLMSLLRIAILGYVRKNWGPGAQNLLLIDDGGPKVSVPYSYRIRTADNLPEIDGHDPAVLDQLGRYVQNMDRVVVSCPMEKRKHWAFFFQAAGIEGEVVTEVGRDLGALGLHRYESFTAMKVSTRPLSLPQRAIKRMFDFAVAGSALLVLLPFLLVIALAIKLDDGGPIFFRQRRVGRGNRFFGVYKFRSMRVTQADSNGDISASRDDKRITRVGSLLRRTSLDELPQLINVFRGDMSMVGPRPHALGSQAGSKLFWEVDRRYWHRHSLRPGLTGLAQIRGYRGATDCEDDLSKRLQADLEYISCWNLWLDITIMVRTARVLIHAKAY